MKALAEFQAWMNEVNAYAYGRRGDRWTPLAVDGKPGPLTRSAVFETFRNRSAPAITEFELAKIATRLGCTIRQIKAVASVESRGSGWDDTGLPKCLWERHYLWKRLRFSVPLLSDPKPGGYTQDADRDGICDSWERVADAALAFSPALAFECASFGKFQIMGAHWKSLGYRSAVEFVWALSRSELANYEAFAKFIEVNGLRPALAQVDFRSADCAAFALGYNGKRYADGAYHAKIAVAFKRLEAERLLAPVPVRTMRATPAPGA